MNRRHSRKVLFGSHLLAIMVLFVATTSVFAASAYETRAGVGSKRLCFSY